MQANASAPERKVPHLHDRRAIVGTGCRRFRSGREQIYIALHMHGIGMKDCAESSIRGRVNIVKDLDKKREGPSDATPAKDRKPVTIERGKAPEWTHSLRQLYDSVVEEPLPDSFKTLLDKLDKRA